MATIPGKGPYGDETARILKKAGGVACIVAVVNANGEGSFDVAGDLDGATVPMVIGMLRQVADEMEDTLRLAIRDAMTSHN